MPLARPGSHGSPYTGPALPPELTAAEATGPNHRLRTGEGHRLGTQSALGGRYSACGHSNDNGWLYVHNSTFGDWSAMTCWA